jgi:hypothetical protein
MSKLPDTENGIGEACDGVETARTARRAIAPAQPLARSALRVLMFISVPGNWMMELRTAAQFDHTTDIPQDIKARSGRKTFP